MVRRRNEAVKRANEAPFTTYAHNDTQASELAWLAQNEPPEKKAERWADWVLRASIRELGVLCPVIYLRRELLDGERRLAIARELDLECPRVVLTSETQAARLHWRLHPARAWGRWVRPGMRRVAIAHMFALELSELPDRRAAWLAEQRRRGRK